MALHPDFPTSPHAVLPPDIRWFPADETLRTSSMEKLMPPPRGWQNYLCNKSDQTPSDYSKY